MKIIKRRKNKRILIIDDEESITELVKMNLEATGKYEVRAENKGSLGLVAARQFRPDLILLDLAMPDMGGGEVSGQLKSNDDTKNIPIVFSTGIMTQHEAATRGGVISGHPVIVKPLGIKELIDVIEKNIG
ncbi:MAG: response regulator [Proteobacteria bacterium]|nr:response regulator [Pseudomonadota bacterium]